MFLCWLHTVFFTEHPRNDDDDDDDDDGEDDYVKLFRENFWSVELD